MHETAFDRPWRNDAHAAGLVGLAHMTSHFFQMLLAPIYPLLMHDFGIGFTEAGFLATVFFVISSSGQAIAGFAVDRIGAFRMLLAGIGLLVAAGVSLGLAQTYAGLLATAALAGAGNAMFHPADFTILNRRVSLRRLGHAFAMHALSGNLGWAAGASFMATISALAGWHTAGFAAALVALAVWFFLLSQRDLLEAGDGQGARRGGSPGPGAPAQTRGGQFVFLRSTTVWLCFAFFFLSTGAGGILQNFAPAILANVYSASMALGAMCLTSYLLGSAAGTVIGGFVAGHERRSELVVAAAMCAGALVSLLLATRAIPPLMLLPALFAVGAGAGTAAPSRDLLVRKAASSRFGAESFGRVYGFVYSGLDSGLAIVPLLMGHVLDRGHFRAGLFAITALYLGATLVALRIGRPS